MSPGQPLVASEPERQSILSVFIIPYFPKQDFPKQNKTSPKKPPNRCSVNEGEEDIKYSEAINNVFHISSLLRKAGYTEVGRDIEQVLPTPTYKNKFLVCDSHY